MMRLVEVIETFNFFWLLSSIEPYFHLPSFLRKPIFIREHFRFLPKMHRRVSPPFHLFLKYRNISGFPIDPSECLVQDFTFASSEVGSFFLSLKSPASFWLLTGTSASRHFSFW